MDIQKSQSRKLRDFQEYKELDRLEEDLKSSSVEKNDRGAYYAMLYKKFSQEKSQAPDK